VKTCKVENCSLKHQAKGYCQKHYYQIRKYGKILTRTNSDPNDYVIKDQVVHFFIYNQQNERVATTIFDVEDLPAVTKHKWCLSGGYPVSFINNKSIKLSQFILKAPKGFLVDHKNHDKLNNLKNNLRICSKRQNGFNQKLKPNNTSGYKGVSAHEYKWASNITVEGKWTGLGRFDNKIDAAHAYDEAARKHFGEFACVNFPKDGEIGAISNQTT